MKKYVRLDCDNVSDQIEYFLYNSETSKAQDLSNNIKGSINKTVAWVKQKFSDSEILLIGADDILFTSAKITKTDLDQIKNIFFQLSNLTISIGVGETIKESMQNLLIAKVSGKNKIIGL